MVLKRREVKDCSRCVKQQQEMAYHRQWTAELAVRSVRTLTTVSVFAMNWCRLQVEVRHRDIPAPGYADSGRREPTVCSRHAVVKVGKVLPEQQQLTWWCWWWLSALKQHTMVIINRTRLVLGQVLFWWVVSHVTSNPDQFSWAILYE